MKIGFGIFCFGEEYYFKGTFEKINRIMGAGYHCYVLTDNPDIFEKKYTPTYLHVIYYNRTNKSYYDKMILPKYVLKHNDICILMDSDLHIKDYSFLLKLKTYTFNEGISYVDSLINHPVRKQYVKDLDLTTNEWIEYKKHCDVIYPQYVDLELIWEYFLVINKNGFNADLFYKTYEKLQLAKEYSDLKSTKNVMGNGEGISIAIASKMSNTTLQKDTVLHDLLDDKLISVSKNFTTEEYRPSWMK